MISGFFWASCSLSTGKCILDTCCIMNMHLLPYCLCQQIVRIVHGSVNVFIAVFICCGNHASPFKPKKWLYCWITFENTINSLTAICWPTTRFLLQRPAQVRKLLTYGWLVLRILNEVKSAPRGGHSVLHALGILISLFSEESSSVIWVEMRCLRLLSGQQQ